MATTVVPSAAPPATPAEAVRQPPGAAHEWTLYAVLLASTCIIVGLIWDISWHMSIGRDTLWSPPHVLEQFGASLAGLACGACVLWTTFAGTPSARARSVRFWGFRGPLGAWVCIWGALAMIVSVPFDDWWHNAYGLDVQILSPPHAVLGVGMLGIQTGAMLFALAAQNRAGAGAASGAGTGWAAADASAAGRRRSLLFLYAAGVLVTMTAIMGFELTGYPNLWRRGDFYVLTAGAFPLFLAAAGRASRLRWPATIAAGTYAGILLLTTWVLQLFPAQPMLAPILNPVERMVPLGFPMLIVVPAAAMDLLMRRFGEGRDGRLAAALSATFVAVMVPVHWLAALFLLSPAARNPFFGVDRWPYTIELGDWRYQYWGLDVAPDGSWSAGAFAGGLGWALLFGFLSARLGLAWGGWMRRVRR